MLTGHVDGIRARGFRDLPFPTPAASCAPLASASETSFAIRASLSRVVFAACCCLSVSTILRAAAVVISAFVPDDTFVMTAGTSLELEIGRADGNTADFSNSTFRRPMLPCSLWAVVPARRLGTTSRSGAALDPAAASFIG